MIIDSCVFVILKYCPSELVTLYLLKFILVMKSYFVNSLCNHFSYVDNSVKDGDCPGLERS